MITSEGSGSSLTSLPSSSPAAHMSVSYSLGSPDGPAASKVGISARSLPLFLLFREFSPSPSSPSSVANPSGRFFHRRFFLPDRNKGFATCFGRIELGKNEGWSSRTTPPRVVVGRVSKGSSPPTNSE